MPQTIVTALHEVGVPGLPFDSTGDIISRVLEEGGNEIPFGVMVARGSGDQDAKLPSDTTDLLLGLVVFSHEYERETDLGQVGLKPGAALNVARSGRYWVQVEEAVVPGDRAHIRVSGTGQPGAFRKSAVAGETIDATAQCEFQSSATAGGLAVIELDMTNK